MDIAKVEDFVIHDLTNNLDGRYTFHNLERAKDLVSKTLEILESYDKKIDKESTRLASWFLYSGFTKDHDNHVNHSINIAESFLSQTNFKEEKIIKVSALIKAAWGDDEPTSTEAKILKDARTAYFGSEDLIELIELQRLELQNFEKDTPKSGKFRKGFINKLNGEHQFYTEYALKNWNKQKEENAINLVGKSLKAEKTKKKEKLKVKLKNQSPERAIQSLYRTQLRNHLKLSDIADTKANILLSVNAIIISLLLANLIPKLGTPNNSYLIYPTVIFIVFSIASMIMSVLATRPKINNEELIDNDLNSENTNFLFFGNFHALALPDFKQKMREIIKSKESIYDSLTMDLYYLGLVLKKKYQLLRRTYTVFIIGVVLSVIAFALALKYYGMDQEIIEAVTPG